MIISTDLLPCGILPQELKGATSMPKIMLAAEGKDNKMLH
jgi:hypothetical protein